MTKCSFFFQGSVSWYLWPSKHWSDVLGAGRAVIPEHFIETIAAEFFNACLRQDYRHHRLTDYTRGRDNTDIATLITARIYIFARGQIY